MAFSKEGLDLLFDECDETEVLSTVLASTSMVAGLTLSIDDGGSNAPAAIPSNTNQMILVVARNREDHPRHQGFADSLEEKSNLDFFRNLRVTKATFELLEDIVISYVENHPGEALEYGHKFALYLCLWYLGNKATFREIAELFGVSEATVFKYVQYILAAICSVSDDYIVWPINQQAVKTEEDFHRLAGFPGVIGAVDGSHIEVKAPKEFQDEFTDRTQRKSVNLMAICDSHKRFTYVHYGYPGAAHDNRVFKYTEVFQIMNTDPLSIFPGPQSHLIGDSAFTLSTYLLVHYKDYGNLTPRKVKFNKKLSSTRIVIENAFGLLKGRFRRL